MAVMHFGDEVGGATLDGGSCSFRKTTGRLSINLSEWEDKRPPAGAEVRG